MNSPPTTPPERPLATEVTHERVARELHKLIWLAASPTIAPSVLDWAGLSSRPTRPTAQVADDHDLPTDTLLARIRGVTRSIAATTPDPAIRADLTRPSQTGEDHLRRTRWAKLLSCPPPGRHRPAQIDHQDRAMAIRAGRILATTGPLTKQDLYDSVNRSRTTTRPPASANYLIAAMLCTGTVQLNPDGQWAATHRAQPHPLWVAVIAAATTTGRTEHTLQQITDLLHTAGYTTTKGPIIYRHPLLQRTPNGLWRILGTADPPQPPG